MAAESSPLFPASLIAGEIASSLPESFTIRPLEKGDYAKGFLECLRDLTWMGNLTEDEFNERYDDIDSQGKGPYYYLVIEHQGRIVGTGAVIVEKKFIHNRALVGHVEEICTAKDLQGKGLGLVMVNALNSVAESVGCYKTILNCLPKNEPFYEKCGYANSSIEMVRQLKEWQEPR